MIDRGSSSTVKGYEPPKALMGNETVRTMLMDDSEFKWKVDMDTGITTTESALMVLHS